MLGERLYVMGGCADAARGVACAAVELLECDGPFWEEAPPLCPPRMGACAVALDARIYLMGGLGHDGALASVQTFDPQRGAWEDAPPLSGGRVAACAVAMRD